MPERARNDPKPGFQRNLDALRRNSSTLCALLDGVLALNTVDDRLYVSTKTNAHIYLGRSFLIRVVFGRDGSIAFHRDTHKDIAADSNKVRAPAFYRALAQRVEDAGGVLTGWAREDRPRCVITLGAKTPDTFVPEVISLFRAELARVS